MYRKLTTGIESFSQQRPCYHVAWDFGFLMVCLLVMYSLEPDSWTQNQEKCCVFWVLGMFWSWERDLPILDCYSRWNLGPSFWTWDKKLVHGLTPFSIFLEEKILSVSKVMISFLGLWRSDSRGCDAERGDSQLVMPTSGCWQKSGSISNEFGPTRVHHTSCLSMTVQGCTQVWRLRNRHGIWLNRVTPSTLQPQSGTSKFPPFWGPERCNPLYKVWDWWLCDLHSENVATQQEKPWYRRGIHKLVPCWHASIEVDGCFVEKYNVEANHYSSYYEWSRNK